MSVILFFVLFVLSILGIICAKKCSTFIFTGNKFVLCLYLSINSAVGCTFFYLYSNFKIVLSIENVIFGLIFALICMGSLLAIPFAYKNNAVSDVEFVNSAGGLILTNFIGFTLLKENISIKKCFLIFAMLAVIFMSFYRRETQKSKTPFGQTSKSKRTISMLLNVVIICLSTIITKLYVLLSDAQTESSFFFLTNVFLFIGATVCALFFFRFENQSKKDLRDFLKPKNVVYICGQTVIANISSLVTLLLLIRIDVTVYTSIGTALKIATGTTVSLILHEKIEKRSAYATIISIITLILFASL